MAGFHFRSYCEETDFDIVYKVACDHGEAVTKYEVSGCSYYPEREMFRKGLRNQFERLIYPCIVADEKDNLAIGLAYPYERYRLGRCWKLMICMWEHPEFTKEVLIGMLDRFFETANTNMVRLQFAGNEEVLLAACREICMKEVGCIPDCRSYMGKLVDEYHFIMKRDAWIEQKQNQE